ncbi:LCP family protein [Candidatus Clostridium stratigraminis]|uniref:LCP family protein n=1 Tax=Candidatus Clostridium stratigraminis TaxID=3381661 RepID=A0ABW8T0W1_9CLOT
MGKLKKLFKEKRLIMIGICSFIVVIAVVLSCYLYIKHIYNKNMLVVVPTAENNNTVPEISSEPVETETNYGEETDIVNVLLVGVDTRGAFNDSRTDSIIIATIDPSTKKVKLTSLMRDMYVVIPGKGYNKINAAFEIGGIDLLKKTIKYNFGLNVDKNIAIDFQGFQSLIDNLDGVELDVKDYEVKEINKYIKEVNGANSTLIQSPGMQKLNGQQALSYCRIRKVGNNDYERTDRQRRVLSLLLSKVKDTSVLSYPKLYSTMSQYVKTNIPFEDMLKIVYTVYKFGDSTTDNLRLPADGYFKDTSINGQSVLIPNLKYSATALYKFIYNTVPSNLKVPDNSAVYNKKPEDTSQSNNQAPNKEATQGKAPEQVPTKPNTQNPDPNNPQQNTQTQTPSDNTNTNTNTNTEGQNPSDNSNKNTTPSQQTNTPNGANNTAP